MNLHCHIFFHSININKNVPVVEELTDHQIISSVTNHAALVMKEESEEEEKPRESFIGCYKNSYY